MKQHKMRIVLATFLALVITSKIWAQAVEVRTDYTELGDCIFYAYNNTSTPLFLHLKFADLENTSFSEPLPYVKRLSPGFNALFTLLLDPNADALRFNYDIKVYHSNPLAPIDLYFPYLIPFSKGNKVKLFDVTNIDGFWGTGKLDSWTATGFYAHEGDAVFAARNGEVVEIVGQERTDEYASWYHAWSNSVTLLQGDGSLICYHNVKIAPNSLKVGDKVYAGQKLALVANNTDGLIVLIYHHSLFSDQPLFVLPEFVIAEDGTAEVLNSSQLYTVFHPHEIRGLEMTKKEKKKILGTRN